jgi:DNA-binding NarL/FixJ family response regulator
VKRTVYIVEDHQDLREIVALYIASRPDVEVCGMAGSGEAALSEIPAVHPDVAIIDVSMPGIDGIELVKRLRNQRLNLSIIMLSGHLDPTYVQAALRAGANAYVGKGNIQALGKALQDVISGNSH